jgi:hypothetical protein
MGRCRRQLASLVVLEHSPVPLEVSREGNGSSPAAVSENRSCAARQQNRTAEHGHQPVLSWTGVAISTVTAGPLSGLGKLYSQMVSPSLLRSHTRSP